MIKNYTTAELEKMDLGEAKNIITQDVYDCTRLIELLEGAGKIRGNGHHIRQKLAGHAEKVLEERWIK